MVCLILAHLFDGPRMKTLRMRLNVRDLFGRVAVQVMSFNSPFKDLPQRLHESICSLGSICLCVAQLAYMLWLHNEGLAAVLLHKQRTHSLRSVRLYAFVVRGLM